MGTHEADGKRSTLKSLILNSWTIPLVYLATLLVAFLRFDLLFQFELGAVALAVIPPVAYFGKSREFMKNSALVVGVLLTYEALQGLTGRFVSPSAIVSLSGIDKAIFGFNVNAMVQTEFASAAVTVISTFFYGLHIFLVVIALVLFWFTSKRLYKGYTYSIVITSYLALATFVLVPTAPPWFSGVAQNLLPAGNHMLPSFVTSLQQALLSIESDKFAAFPSLHAAYVTLFSIYLFRLKPRYGYMSLFLVFGVFFATVYLGQHYIVDLIGGVLYSLVGVWAVDHLILPRLHDEFGSRDTIISSDSGSNADGLLREAPLVAFRGERWSQDEGERPVHDQEAAEERSAAVSGVKSRLHYGKTPSQGAGDKQDSRNRGGQVREAILRLGKHGGSLGQTRGYLADGEGQALTGARKT
jgi:membrane-associated phospholipid phosphatase